MSKELRNLTAYQIDPSFAERLCRIHEGGTRQTVSDHLMIAEPGNTEWSRMGFIDLGLGPFADVGYNGDTQMLIGFNERILPANVIKEAVVKRVVELEERQGYKMNRKQIAEVKEEAIAELLPKAFIKHTEIRVVVTSTLRNEYGFLFIFTSSAKRCDDILQFLSNVFGGWKEWHPAYLQVKGDVDAGMREIATQTGGTEDRFFPGNTILMTGADKRTIRVRNVDVEEEQVQRLLDDIYDVKELSLNYYASSITDPNEEEPTASFVLTSNLIVKRLLVSSAYIDEETKDDEGVADQYAYLFLVVTVARTMIVDLAAEFGGLKPYGRTQENSNGSSDSKTGVDSEDDEL